MKIAVEGCCHGELDAIYEALKTYEKRNLVKVDLLIICGDFQAVRNRTDLNAMAVPHKYRDLKTFYKYYSGECVAPVLTLFVGGNHEASNYLQELPYGGWVAKNIYYMGYANVVQFGDLRIAGISGIYKKYHYNIGHHERPPYSKDDIKSVYHMRNIEVFRLKQIRQPIDIFISHDWPRGIYNFGDANALLRYKKHFRREMETGELGNPATEELLFALKPKHWFAAHMHCRFQALVQHKMNDGTVSYTNFLALDKCLPNRKFMEVIEMTSSNSDDMCKLRLDPEWMSILKLSNHLFSISRSICYLPPTLEKSEFTASAESLQSIHEDFMTNFAIPENFCRTAPIHSNTTYDASMIPQLNPQTQLLTSMLDLIDPFATILGKSRQNMSTKLNISTEFSPKKHNTDSTNSPCQFKEIDNSFTESFNNSDFINSTINSSFNSSLNRTMSSSINSSFNLSKAFNKSSNPDEINLDEDESEEASNRNDDSSLISERNNLNEISVNKQIGETCSSAGENSRNINFSNFKKKLSDSINSPICASSPAINHIIAVENYQLLRAEDLEREWIATAKNDNLVEVEKKNLQFDDLDEEELAFLGPAAKKLSPSPISSNSSNFVDLNKNTCTEQPILNEIGKKSPSHVLVDKIEKNSGEVIENNTRTKSMKRRNEIIYVANSEDSNYKN